MPNTQNADSQMSRQVNASEEKDSSDDEVRGKGKDAQRDLFDGNSPDRAFHQGNQIVIECSDDGAGWMRRVIWACGRSLTDTSLTITGHLS